MKNKRNILFSPIMILKKKYILTRHWITVFVLFAVTPIAFAQQNAKQIDDLMGRYVDNGKFNGSVLVAENGKVIFKKGYGLANMEWNIPNTPDTKFRLGSLTKQFTAMLIMQLVEQGKLKLEGKITDYLTDYPKAAGDKITIHHLLTHTSSPKVKPQRYVLFVFSHGRTKFRNYKGWRFTDVTMIQKLLGHNDLKTMLRYLHTSNKDLLKIISPFTDLKLT